MKSPGVIYRHYRLVRHNQLLQELQKNLKRCPQNCHYWKEISLKDEHGKGYKVPLCYLGQQEGKSLNTSILTICSTVDNAQKCNAYSLKNKKEDIEKKLISDLNDPKVKFEKYPELATLEWVLDKSLHEARISPNFIARSIIYLIASLENLLIRINQKKA